MHFLTVLWVIRPHKDSMELVAGDRSLTALQMDKEESPQRFLLIRILILFDKDLIFICLYNLDQFLIGSISKHRVRASPRR